MSTERRDWCIVKPKRKLESPPVVEKTTVGRLNRIRVQPQRAGVIPYTIYDGVTYFGLGIDADTHDLTDFGGSVKYRKDRDAINGALREFNEETLQIFEYFSAEQIAACPILYDERNLIIWIHLDLDPNQVCTIFNQKHAEILKKIPPDNTQFKSRWSQRKSPEVCGITWLSWDELQLAIRTPGILFTRVQRFLHQAGDFSSML